MKTRLLSKPGMPRTFVVVFDAGDSVIDGLLAFGTQHELAAASFTAIGAFARVTLGYFDPERREYDQFDLDQQVEVLVLSGTMTTGASGARTVHAHVVVGLADTTARGGHLMSAVVRPTLEVIVNESPADLRRRPDPATGLALIDAG
jgi:uncharacterized protein